MQSCDFTSGIVGIMVAISFVYNLSFYGFDITLIRIVFQRQSHLHITSITSITSKIFTIPCTIQVMTCSFQTWVHTYRHHWNKFFLMLDNSKLLYDLFEKFCVPLFYNKNALETLNLMFMLAKVFRLIYIFHFQSMRIYFFYFHNLLKYFKIYFANCLKNGKNINKIINSLKYGNTFSLKRKVWRVRG